MYSFDYLEDIRKLEAFLCDGPEKTEHSFERDEFLNVVHFKKRSPDLLEKIQRERDELLSNNSVNIIVEFDEDLEILIKSEENISFAEQ